MITLLSPNYKLEAVSEDDIIIASIVWGFTLGFGVLTVWSAVKQTVTYYQKRTHDTRLCTPYIVMVWLEIVVCLAFSIICWLYLRGVIPPSFAFYFCILTLWALQVQFLLQIIINRVSILMIDRKRAQQLKWGVAALITAVNISVYCIWIPARLQISERYVHINDVWDRCEKSIYLLVDASLNFYFIRTVQKSLVKPGLSKYKPLVQFNSMIIFVSLGMDVLIISTMSLRNSFVYMQFHPLAYTVKLRIEMSMADLISSVAHARDNETGSVFLSGGITIPSNHERESVYNPKTGASAIIKAFSQSTTSFHKRRDSHGVGGFINTYQSHGIEMDAITDGKTTSGEESPQDNAAGFVVHRQDEVHMEFESRPQEGRPKEGRKSLHRQPSKRASDEEMMIRQERRQSQIWGLRPGDILE